MRSKMSGILPDLSSQSVLSHNWLLLFLFVHALTSRERGAFGGCGGHIERQGEALGREDQLQTYKRRFDDEEEDSTTSTTNLFNFRSWSWRSMKVVRDRVYWNLKDAFLWKGFESSKTSLMYPWPLDMVLANPPQNKNVNFATEVLKHQGFTPANFQSFTDCWWRMTSPIGSWSWTKKRGRRLGQRRGGRDQHHDHQEVFRGEGRLLNHQMEEGLDCRRN